MLEEALDSDAYPVDVCLSVIKMSLKVMQETRRVLGLDAPVKVELVNEPDPRISPADIARIAQQAARDYYRDEDDDDDEP